MVNSGLFFLCIASFMHVHVFFEQIFEGYASNKWISATIAHHRQSSSTHHSNDVVRSCFSSVENGNLQQKNKSIVGNIPRRWQLTFYESIIGNSTRHSTDNWPLPFGHSRPIGVGKIVNRYHFATFSFVLYLVYPFQRNTLHGGPNLLITSADSCPPCPATDKNVCLESGIGQQGHSGSDYEYTWTWYRQTCWSVFKKAQPFGRRGTRPDNIDLRLASRWRTQ